LVLYTVEKWFLKYAPIVSTIGGFLAKILALFQILDEEFDVQEIVLAQLAFQVVDHPLGAALKQISLTCY